MKVKIHQVYFSPTKTTKTIVEQITAGIHPNEIETYDLTYRGFEIDTQFTDGLAIIGIPVYAGRVPEICLERLNKLSATGVPVVLVALYGNREYEDAMVELRDVAVSKGFRVIAAGAFIGEHSYSTDEQPIAANRPDRADLDKAKEFGKSIGYKLQLSVCAEAAPEIPGNVPYKERPPLGGIAPETDYELCTLCGICASVCPIEIITVADKVTTKAENCVMCCACVKVCPEQARALQHPMIAGRREMLINNCSARKEPQLFL